MTVVATKITGVPDVVMGNQRVHTRRLTFSDNYAAGGEPLTGTVALNRANFGLSRITRVIMHAGVASAAALTTGNPIGYNSSTGKVTFYDSAGDGDLMDEKPAEAFATGSFVNATAYGYR